MLVITDRSVLRVLCAKAKIDLAHNGIDNPRLHYESFS